MGQCGKLTAVKSTALKRTTVHQANGDGVIGVTMCGETVPIVFPVMVCGELQNVILATGDRRYGSLQYSDLGLGCESCRTVLQFNIDHYFKCYLPGSIGTNGDITQPYEYGHCRKCDVAIEDSCGHLIAFTNTREWRRDRYIHVPEEFLQDCGKEQCNV